MLRAVALTVLLTVIAVTPAHAQGGGGGGGGGGGVAGACANELRLFRGTVPVWAHAHAEFERAPGVAPLQGGHRPGQPALALSSLAGSDGALMIEVAACGGQTHQFRDRALGSRQLYVVANRRDGFKLVEILPDGSERTLARSIGRITIVTPE